MISVYLTFSVVPHKCFCLCFSNPSPSLPACFCRTFECKTHSKFIQSKNNHFSSTFVEEVVHFKIQIVIENIQNHTTADSRVYKKISSFSFGDINNSG